MAATVSTYFNRREDFTVYFAQESFPENRIGTYDCSPSGGYRVQNTGAVPMSFCVIIHPADHSITTRSAAVDFDFEHESLSTFDCNFLCCINAANINIWYNIYTSRSAGDITESTLHFISYKLSYYIRYFFFSKNYTTD